MFNLSLAPCFHEITKKFENYEVEEEIGAGAFGLVIKARDIYTNKNFACKFISRSIMEKQPWILKNLQKEIRIQNFLNHSNIVKLYDVILLQEYVVLILEWCENGDLFNYMCKYSKPDQNPSVSFKDILHFSLEIAEGLHYLHQQGIGHCDLKLENLLLNEEKKIKICDFGSSYVENSKEKCDCSFTPLFMPPEVDGINERGERQLNYITMKGYSQFNPKKADIWSLGFLILTLCYGSYPYLEEDPWKVRIIRIREVTKTIPVELQKVVNLCLQIDPKRRGTLEEIIKELRSIQDQNEK